MEAVSNRDGGRFEPEMEAATRDGGRFEPRWRPFSNPRWRAVSNPRWRPFSNPRWRPSSKPEMEAVSTRDGAVFEPEMEAVLEPEMRPDRDGGRPSNPRWRPSSNRDGGVFEPEMGGRLRTRDGGRLRARDWRPSSREARREEGVFEPENGRPSFEPEDMEAVLSSQEDWEPSSSPRWAAAVSNPRWRPSSSRDGGRFGEMEPSSEPRDGRPSPSRDAEGSLEPDELGGPSSSRKEMQARLEPVDLEAVFRPEDGGPSEPEMEGRLRNPRLDRPSPNRDRERRSSSPTKWEGRPFERRMRPSSSPPGQRKKMGKRAPFPFRRKKPEMGGRFLRIRDGKGSSNRDWRAASSETRDARPVLFETDETGGVLSTTEKMEASSNRRLEAGGGFPFETPRLEAVFDDPSKMEAVPEPEMGQSFDPRDGGRLNREMGTASFDPKKRPKKKKWRGEAASNRDWRRLSTTRDGRPSSRTRALERAVLEPENGGPVLDAREWRPPRLEPRWRPSSNREARLDPRWRPSSNPR
ncbi:hypothetical protein C7M84_018931 [Penaeus vannamei]|uniref:Uncharacterized protein n=1 Tax=Penaeus vannamei TaxID=6689 RepID=A0A3R7SJ32_PENVA|nr:hypothetical protein C7M84_018931 [Penaeus vannamei]